MNKNRRADFSKTSFNSKATSFNQKRDVIDIRPSLVKKQINKELPSNLRSKLVRLFGKPFIEEVKHHHEELHWWLKNSEMKEVVQGEIEEHEVKDGDSEPKSPLPSRDVQQLSGAELFDE